MLYSISKFHLPLFILLIFFTQSTNAQPISPIFFGQNAWMPDTVGEAKKCRKPPCVLYGKLHWHWGDIQKSSAQIIRYGGKRMDRNVPTKFQYIRIVDSIRTRGMEPILQVSCDKNKYTAGQAADIVRYVNVTMGRKVKYWSIGNEPEKEYRYMASDIAKYTREFSSAMKAVDSTILILGPELSRLDTIVLQNFMNPDGPDDLCGKNEKGHYYLDVFTFHYYPFSGTQDRASVISKATAPFSYEDRLIALNEGLKRCNAFHKRTGKAALKMAITEINISYKNLNDDEDIQGVGTNSFLGGQAWAEMLGIGMKHQLAFMNFFSVIEGKGTNTNIGYIDSYDGKKKSSYYHFKLMADHFKGSFCESLTNKKDVKVFASNSASQVAVLVMNQDLTEFKYNLRLDKNSGMAGAPSLTVNVNANIPKEYADTIAGQSSVLLLFDMSGRLVQKYEYTLNGQAEKKLPPALMH